MDAPLIQEEEIICQCYQVSEARIRSAIESRNLSAIEQVTEACEAGGGCHSCHILIQLFIDEHEHRNVPLETLVAEHARKVKKRGILSKFFNRFKTSNSHP